MKKTRLYLLALALQDNFAFAEKCELWSWSAAEADGSLVL